MVFHCKNCVQVDEVAEAIEESSEDEVFVNYFFLFYHIKKNKEINKMFK
jgi:hypothetical protein